jgi:signal transduction protein with GAF and PtsI domain
MAASHPGVANEYHVLGTNITYAKYLADRAAKGHGNLIQRVTAAMATASCPQDVYNAVVSLCQCELGAQACALFVEDDAANELGVAAAAGYPKEFVTRPVAYRKGEGITGTVWETAESIKCNSHDEVLRHPRRSGKHDEYQWTPGTRCENFLAVAVRHSSAPFAVLKVENKREGIRYVPFTDQDVATLELIASLIAYAVRFGVQAQ